MLTPEEKIKVFRKKYKLSQKEVCKGVCGESNLSQIENGRIKLKKNGNGRQLIVNINKLLERKGIPERVDEHWVFESVEVQIKRRINNIIIEIYKTEDIKKIEQEIKSLFLRHIDPKQGARVFFTLGSYFNRKKSREKAKRYFLKSLDYASECKNYSLLTITILQLLRLNYYLGENSKSRELYTHYFKKYKMPSREVEAIVIYNYALAFQCLGSYKEAINLYSLVSNYTIKIFLIESAKNNTAFCLQEIKEYDEALKTWKGIAQNALDPLLKLRAICNIVSCTRVMKDYVQCKLTIQKAEKIISNMKDESLYQKYYCLGMGYNYIEDKENAIRCFEEELKLGIDLSSSRFYPSKYLECILYLLQLYTKKDEKKIINLKNIIENLPREMLSLEFALSVIKIFNDYLFASETTSIINNLHKKIKKKM